MSLRLNTRTKPRIRGSRLTDARERTVRGARALRDTGLTTAQEGAARGARKMRGAKVSAAQKRAIRDARKRAVRSARTGILRGADLVREAQRRDMPRRAVRGARQTAERTAERLAPAADQARDMAVSGLYSARVWGAPRIDRAGDYVEHYLGPRVGSLLRWTAVRVEPAKVRRGRRGIAATLIVAGGALGAAGAIATRKSVARRQADERMHASADHLSAVSESSNGERARTS